MPGICFVSPSQHKFELRSPEAKEFFSCSQCLFNRLHRKVNTSAPEFLVGFASR